MICLIGLVIISCRAPVTQDGAEIPVAFLRDRVRKVLVDLEQGEAALSVRDDQALARLEGARFGLRRLDEYYLPLLAALQQVGRAARAVASDVDAARTAVDSAEAVLMQIVRAHGRHLEAEMRGPLERLQDARTALEAANGREGRRILERLHEHLRSIFFRGDLVLRGSELDPRRARSPE